MLRAPPSASASADHRAATSDVATWWVQSMQQSPQPKGIPANYAAANDGLPQGLGGGLPRGDGLAAESPPLDPTLLQLIEGLMMPPGAQEEAIRAARGWCDAEGVESFATLKEVEMEDEFVAALQLKVAKQKQLRRRITERRPNSAATSISGPSRGNGEADESPPLDPALVQLIEGLKLGWEAQVEALRAARAWCAAEGVESFATLKEVGMEDEFVAALQLRTAKQKQLHQRISYVVVEC
jgi:hypothetical protein